jgi:hypothetical protein
MKEGRGWLREQRRRRGRWSHEEEGDGRETGG